MVTPESGGSGDKRYVLYNYFYFTLVFPFWCRSSRLQSTTAKKDVGHQQKSSPTKTEGMPVTPSRNFNKCVSTFPRPLAYFNVANLLPGRQRLLSLSRRSMSHQMKIHLPCHRSRLQRPKGRALHECPPQLKYLAMMTETMDPRSQSLRSHFLSAMFSNYLSVELHALLQRCLLGSFPHRIPKKLRNLLKKAASLL